MKKIIAEAELTAEQLDKCRALAQKTGLCAETVRILYGRGIDTEDKISAFMHPGKHAFLSPFLMSGMKEAVELIKRARDEEWSVVVYGDYDADGVCASTIMCRVLADFGIRAEVFVPERKNGYGLSIEAIDNIFEEYFPQLFITVDCGISCAQEVEYIKEQGAEVIVTDHHELPEILPDCIVINPKLEDSYPYDNLCGAGVAFKVGCALNGKEAYKYLDFAAIATVADSVPLTGENRDIVAEGLNLINSAPRKNYSNFYKQGEKVTAQTIAFSVAPKINAAGRMGDANAALKLFLSDDENEIYNCAVQLTAYNTERQKYCDELYLSAKSKLKEKGAHGRVILLWDESWNTGFVGIVAARLAEEYCRPTMLFVKSGDKLKGSARSVDGVNIFEALKACDYLIDEFGGHSQAAGVNVSKDKIDELEQALDNYLHQNYSAQAFTPSYVVNGKHTAAASLQFARELELLEPCGVGNKKPLFVMPAGDLHTRALKLGSNHVVTKCGGLDMIFFSGAKYAEILKSPLPKSLVFEYSLSTFRGREQLKGYLRDVIYNQADCGLAQESYKLNSLTLVSGEETAVNAAYIGVNEAQNIIDGCDEYGTLFIAYAYSTLKKFDLSRLEINAFTPSVGSFASAVILSPLKECDFSAYETVVFLDDPVRVTLPSLSGKNVLICKQSGAEGQLSLLDTDRVNLLSVFKVISANEGNLYGDSLKDIARDLNLGVPPEQAYFALKVFEELGLITFNEGKITVNRGLKTQLTNSRLYNFVSNI